MAGRGGGRIENNGETEFVKLRSIRDSAATHEFADSEEVVFSLLQNPVFWHDACDEVRRRDLF